MSTFGTRPEDVVTDSKGNVQSGVTLALYPTEADANSQSAQLTTVTTNSGGSWEYVNVSYDVIWVRTPTGKVYPCASETGAGGVTDHGGLTGLGDDDHPQYLLAANAVPLASSSPSPLAAAAFVGSANTAARGDHVHVLPDHRSPSVVTKSTYWTAPTGRKGGTNHALTYQRMELVPIPWWPRSGPVAVTGLGVQVNTAAPATGVVRLGLYGSDSDGFPNLANLIVDGGTTLIDTTGIKTVTFAATAALQGMLWAAFVWQVASGAAPQFTGTNESAHAFMPVPTINNPGTHFIDSITGALPTSGGLNVSTNTGPVVWVRAA